MNWHWLVNIIGIGRATGLDDTGQVQQLQVTEGAVGTGFADRVIDKVKRVAEFGFTSVPPLDSEVVMIRLGADRSCSIVIGTSHRPSRPTGLSPGDAALYDVRGAIIKLSAAGLLIDAASLPMVIQNASKITLDTPEVDVTGLLKVIGDGIIEVGGTAIDLKALHDAYNAHKHTGVQTGSGSSGVTDHAA